MKKHILALAMGFFSCMSVAQAQIVNFNALTPSGTSQTLSFDAGQGYKHRFVNTAPQGSMSRLTLQVTNPSQTTFKDAMTITTDGVVGIGTSFPSVITTPGAVNPTDFLNYKLYVKGGIKAEKILVEFAFNWGDFVFEPHYKLMPLTALQKFINTHKHLPEIPSAKEIEAKGIDVGEMQRLQMIKIEELTLYLLELKKENDELRERVEKLESQVKNEKK